MDPFVITIISAGLRVPSSTRLLADQIGREAREAIAGSLSPDTPIQVRHIEVREHAHAIADALLTGFPAGQLREALADVVAADALIVVSPTFQASFSGLFKSFVDLIEMDQLRGTPVLLAATGGTERHSLVIEHALRPLFAHLGAFPVPTGVYAATADFGGDYAPALAARVTRAAQELARLAAGGSTSGSSLRRPPVDEFAQVTPFAALLAAAGQE